MTSWSEGLRRSHQTHFSPQQSTCECTSESTKLDVIVNKLLCQLGKVIIVLLRKHFNYCFSETRTPHEMVVCLDSFTNWLLTSWEGSAHLVRNVRLVKCQLTARIGGRQMYPIKFIMSCTVMRLCIFQFL